MSITLRVVNRIVETIQAIRNLLRHKTTCPENFNTSKATETLDKSWAIVENSRPTRAKRKTFFNWNGDKEVECVNWPASANGVMPAVVRRNNNCEFLVQCGGAISTLKVELQ